MRYGADQGKHPEDQPGDRRRPEGSEQAELICLLELVGRHQVRHGRVFGGVQNSEAHEARNWTTYSQVSWLAKPTEALIGIVR